MSVPFPESTGESDDDGGGGAESSVLSHISAAPVAQRTPQNNFVVDDGRAQVESFGANAALVARRRGARAARAAELQARSDRAGVATPDASPGDLSARERPRARRRTVDPDVVVPATQPAGADESSAEITLAVLASRLRNPDSKVRQLFLETLRENNIAWLERLLVRKRELTERAAPAPAAKDDLLAQDEILLDKQKDDRILSERLAQLELDLNEELSFLNTVLPALNPRAPPPEPVAVAGGQRRSKRVLESESSTSGEIQFPALTTPQVARIARITGSAAAALDALDELIGLVEVKDHVASLLASLWLEVGLRRESRTRLFGDHRNILLFGAPGTGKTDSARRIRNILRAVGLLADRRALDLPSYSRADLVAAFEGQTAIKVRRAFVQNWGSAIFIDEIYSLNLGSGRDQGGLEAVDMIVKVSDEYRGEVLMIGAGYERAIRERLLRSNPGFNSRFPEKWQLPNYSALQLHRILLNMYRDASGNQLLVAPTAVAGAAVAPRRTPTSAELARAAASLTERNTSAIMLELIDRARVLGYFSEQNARGARALALAFDAQRQRRLFHSALMQSRGDEIDFAAPFLPVDVYRGFAAWILQAVNVYIYYTDASVDLLVGDYE